MAEEQGEYWTAIWNMFNPGQPLVGAQLEGCYVEREFSPVAPLLLTLQPERLAQKVLFTGQRGSGKTSALVRLFHQLSEAYMAVWIDVEQSLDTYSMSILDLLLAVGGGIHKVAFESDLNPAPEAWEEMIGALNTLLAQVSRTSGAGGPVSPFDPAYQVDAEDFLRSMVCARGDPAMPLVLQPSTLAPKIMKLDRYEDLRVGPVLREMVARINQVIGDVEAKAGRPVLAVVDGLDKLPRALAEAVFDYTSALIEIRCRTVYTLPYDLYAGQGLVLRNAFDIHELPNVKLYERGRRDARYAPGFAMLRDVVQARLKALDLKLTDVIAAEALDRLVWCSGGVLRVLMRLMQQASLVAQLAKSDRILLKHADIAVDEEQRSRTKGFGEDEIAYLRMFEANRERGNESYFLNQLKEGNIVAYADRNRIWYAVHPNVLPLLEA